MSEERFPSGIAPKREDEARGQEGRGADYVEQVPIGAQAGCHGGMVAGEGRLGVDGAGLGKGLGPQRPWQLGASRGLLVESKRSRLGECSHRGGRGRRKARPSRPAGQVQPVGQAAEAAATGARSHV